MTERANANKGVSAGRGLVFITGAKLWFMLAGYVLQFALPRALGSPALMGVWGFVTNFLNPVNNVIVTGTIQGVSKFTAEAEDRQPAVTRAALKLQVFLGGGTALGFFLLAPAFARWVHDPSLTSYFRIAAGVVLAYSFYTVFVGAANGSRQFHKQAGLDVTSATLRCIFIVAAAALTHSVMACLGAFVASASTILVVAAVVVGLGGTAAKPFAMAPLLRFFGGVWFYLALVNLIMFVDGIVLEHFATRLMDAHAAKAEVGYYTTVQTLARLPYQLILAVTFVIFPLVSRSTFENDVEKTRGYVRTTMRYSLAVVALFGAVIGARPDAIMRFVYPSEYAVGAASLPTLVLGYVFFSLFNIAGTIVNGSGRTLPTTLIGLVTLGVGIAAEWIGVGAAYAHGLDPLFAAAAATTAAMGLGLVLFGAYLGRTLGAFIPLLSLARVALAWVAVAAFGWAWTRAHLMPGKVGTLVSLALAGGIYLVVMVVTGELAPAELKRLLRRGAPPVARA